MVCIDFTFYSIRYVLSVASLPSALDLIERVVFMERLNSSSRVSESRRVSEAPVSPQRQWRVRQSSSAQITVAECPKVVERSNNGSRMFEKSSNIWGVYGECKINRQLSDILSQLFRHSTTFGHTAAPVMVVHMLDDFRTLDNLRTFCCSCCGCSDARRLSLRFFRDAPDTAPCRS